ncbi:MAG: stage II sporulation protein D [Bacillota bacterium]|nr:stage II sporulation protein D [Bacillota bacterium]
MLLKKIVIILALSIFFIMSVSIIIGGINIGDISTKPTKDVAGQDINSKDQADYNDSNAGEGKIRVYITDKKKIQSIDFEEYVMGVVCAEMPAEFNIEALKAQAVAARTFAAAHMEQYGGKRYKDARGADVCDTVQCQVYMSKEDRLKTWPKKNAEELLDKVTKAVEGTKGEVIYYNGKIISEPYYFAVSAGKTENSIDITGENEPYLKSVSSPGEEIAPKYKSEVKISYLQLSSKINKKYPKANVSVFNLNNKIQIIKRTEGGSVKEIKIGDITITGGDFRSLVGLNSSNFDISFHLTGIQINCKGYGHGLGMSQWGAKVMAEQGKNYKEIITHYYNGVKIQKLK